MKQELDPHRIKSMEKICKKSKHPNVHICRKTPDSQSGRKTHKIINRLLKKIKRRERRKGLVSGRGSGKDNRGKVHKSKDTFPFRHRCRKISGKIKRRKCYRKGSMKNWRRIVTHV